MADTGFQLVLNALAQVVGGTVSTADSHFFSGDIAGDATGVSGLKGCYSVPPRNIQSTPVGIVLPGPFKAQLASQGEEDNEDDCRLLLLVAPYDSKAQVPVLTSFRDSVPDAFRKHMGAYSTVNLYAWISAGSPGVHDWGGIGYFAWDFTVTVARMVATTYTP